MSGMKYLLTIIPNEARDAERYLFDDEPATTQHEGIAEFKGTSINRSMTAWVGRAFNGFWTLSEVTQEEAIAYINSEMGEEVAELAKRAWTDAEDFEDEAPE